MKVTKIKSSPRELYFKATFSSFSLGHARFHSARVLSQYIGRICTPQCAALVRVHTTLGRAALWRVHTLTWEMAHLWIWTVLLSVVQIGNVIFTKAIWHLFMCLSYFKFLTLICVNMILFLTRLCCIIVVFVCIIHVRLIVVTVHAVLRSWPGHPWKIKLSQWDVYLIPKGYYDVIFGTVVFWHCSFNSLDLGYRRATEIPEHVGTLLSRSKCNCVSI